MSEQPKLPPGWEDEPAAVLPKVKLSPSMPLMLAVQRWLGVNSSIRTDKTRYNHERTVLLLSEFLGRDALVEDITDETLAQFWRWRSETVSPNTVNSEGLGLLAFAKWLARKHLIESPDVRPPDRVRRRPRALSAEAMDRLVRAAYRHRIVIKGVPGDVIFLALLLVMYQTAERIGAVKLIEWEDVDLVAGWIRFPAENRKRGQVEIVRAINNQCIDALQKLREAADGPPIGVFRRSLFYPHWHGLIGTAGLEDWVTPHVIRKSAASHLPTLEDARELLGHSSSSVTAMNYRDERVNDEKRVLDKLPKVGQRKSWFKKLIG